MFFFLKIFRISIEAMQGNGGLDNALVMIFVIFAREAQRAVDQDGNLWMLLRDEFGIQLEESDRHEEEPQITEDQDQDIVQQAGLHHSTR